MNELTIYLIITVVIGIGIFILCREFFCWYFKITEVSNSLKNISDGINSLSSNKSNSNNEKVDVQNDDYQKKIRELEETIKEISSYIEKEKFEKEREISEEESKSISHYFDGDNEWVGYEYETFVSKNHIRTSKYDNSGKLINIKHTFTEQHDSQSVDDFVSYMDRTKSISFNDNVSYIRDMNRKPIDLTSSIEESKIFRSYDKKNNKE